MKSFVDYFKSLNISDNDSIIFTGDFNTEPEC